MTHLIGGNTIIIPKNDLKEEDRAAFRIMKDSEDLIVDCTFQEPTIIASKKWVRENLHMIRKWSVE